MNSARTLHRRLWLHASSLALAGGVLGCGTVLHPERRGQPSGRLDWGVVLLDGLGLIFFFFVPGVIAFAVDFATGAIYLPPESTDSSPPAAGPLERVETASAKPSLLEIEQAVSEHVGHPIQLAHREFHSEPLSDLREFWKCRLRWQQRADEPV